MFKTLAFFLLLLPFGCLAQVDSTVSKSIFAKLEKYSADHITEKAYLHFDKPFHAAGDTIYFKAYLTLGDRHELSALSGVLHVELIDNATNKITQSEKLEVTNGVAWGDFALPDSLPKGNYRVRAYTQWMRNDGEKDFFEQTIPIGAVIASKMQNNNTSATTKPATATATATPPPKPDIQFFPEGGSMVTGIRSKVAFKAINTNGVAIAVKGEVTDNDNKEIGTFQSAHLGMGYFYITPKPGKTYTAQLTYANGTKDIVNLPTANEDGIALSVNNDSTQNASITIAAGKTCYENNKGKDYTLAIYSGGALTNIIFKLDTPVVTGGLLKQQLHSGITRLTLFSPTGEPLCERLIFIKNDDQLKLNLSSDKTSYNKREKVTIKLNVQNSNSEPVTGDFSVAVTDESKVPVDEGNESIINNLLLTSDLKGYVEQPNYYFSTASPEINANLDLLMLTQGYRHFEWQQVLNDTTKKPKYQPEKLLSLSGTVETLSGKPVPNAEMSLGAIRQLIAKDTTADENGNFQFNNLDITDTAKVLLRIKGNKKIEITQPGYPPIIPINNADTTINPITPQIAAEMHTRYQQQQQSGNMRTGILLKQVNIKDKKDHPWTVHLIHSINLNGPGHADQVIMGDKLMGCANLAQCLASLIRGGVRFVFGHDGILIIFSLHTPIALNRNTKPMAVLVDGVIRDQSALGEIPYTDVYSIEILVSYQYLTIYGSAASGGLIVITTRRGDERGTLNIQPGLTTYTFDGFYKARTFYSPKYDAPKPVNSPPDMRTTIFWQPVVLTDKDGNASFSFYNADGAGTYRVVIEGIDDKGNIGRQVYTYQVQ